MNIGWNIETYISIISFVLAIAGSLFIIKIDWKKYGLLFLVSGITGVMLCYIFTYLNMYTFPYRLFPNVSKIPLTAILTAFPFVVLFGVRYSPKYWAWKIPFYWCIVHLGMLSEAWAESQTQLIKYNSPWDIWASYTWWWIYLLIFDWIGGLIVPQNLRKPISTESFGYGKLGFFIIHLILIATIFLAGVYTGQTLLQ